MHSFQPYLLAGLLVLLPALSRAQSAKIEYTNAAIWRFNGWHLTIKDIVRNEYHEKGTDKGDSLLCIKGYSLAHTITLLGSEARAFVKIDKLGQNPPIYLCYEGAIELLASRLPEIMDTLAVRYGFQYHRTIQSKRVFLLTIANKDKWQAHRSRWRDPAVLNTAMAKKGKLIMKNYNLADLANWLGKKYLIPVEAATMPQERIDLILPDRGWSQVVDVLTNTYGVEVKETYIKRSTYLIR